MDIVETSVGLFEVDLGFGLVTVLSTSISSSFETARATRTSTSRRARRERVVFDISHRQLRPISVVGCPTIPLPKERVLPLAVIAEFDRRWEGRPAEDVPVAIVGGSLVGLSTAAFLERLEGVTG